MSALQVTDVIVSPLEPGRTGRIDIVLANPGTQSTGALTATVNLPDGIWLRLFGAPPRRGWTCAGTSTVSCAGAPVRPGRTTVLRLPIRAGNYATGGPVTGMIRSTFDTVTVPPTMLTIVD